MTAKYPPPQIIVKHQNIDLTIKFSNISRKDSPEKALNTFVAELLYALAAIHILWPLWTTDDKETVVGDLLWTVTQAVLHYVNDTAIHYTETYIPPKEKGAIQPALAPETAQRVAHFEEKFRPLVHQLRIPITLMQGWMKLARLSKEPKVLEKVLSKFPQAKDDIVFHILRPYYIEHRDERVAQEDAPTVPLPETAAVEAFIKQHFKQTIADRVQNLKRISEDMLRETKYWNELDAWQWFEDERQKFENFQIEIKPDSLDSGFFRKYRIIDVTIRPGDYLRVPSLPGRDSSSGPFSFDGETLAYLDQNQAQLEAMFRAEARPFYEASAYHIAKLLTTLLVTEGWTWHAILSSDSDILLYSVEGYEFNIEELKMWLGQIESPRISGDQKRGWQLEFSSLYGALLNPRSIVNHRIYISPNFSIEFSNHVVAENPFSKIPEIDI